MVISENPLVMKISGSEERGRMYHIQTLDAGGDNQKARITENKGVYTPGKAEFSG
jgi:hypothetical protein